MFGRWVKLRCCNVHIHTSVSFTRWCSNKVKVRWKILLVSYLWMVSGYNAKKLLKSANIWQSYSKNKSGPVFLTHNVTLWTIYSDRSTSNFKNHYGDAATAQCLGMIDEINVVSVSEKMLRVIGQMVDCCRVVGQQQQQSDRRQWHAATGGRREDWRSTSAAGLDVSSADQRRTAAGLTSTEVQCREELGRQWPPVWTWRARVLGASKN